MHWEVYGDFIKVAGANDVIFVVHLINVHLPQLCIVVIFSSTVAELVVA